MYIIKGLTSDNYSFYFGQLGEDLPSSRDAIKFKFKENAEIWILDMLKSGLSLSISKITFVKLIKKKVK